MAKYAVAKEGDIAPQTAKLVHIRGRPVAVFNVSGEYFAILNKCPHQGGDLCKGKLIGLVESSEPGSYAYTRRGEILRCPWHGWEFDMRTGRSVSRPADVGTRNYPVSVGPSTGEPDVLFAETFDVSVEDRIIFVTL